MGAESRLQPDLCAAWNSYLICLCLVFLFCKMGDDSNLPQGIAVACFEEGACLLCCFLNLLKADIIRVSHHSQLVPLIASNNFLLSPRGSLFTKPFDTS